MRQGIEHAQRDADIEHLAALSPENQVNDLGASVLHATLLAQDMLLLLIHATYAFLFFPEVLSDGPPNAAPQPLQKAGARDERTLEAVGCRRWFGKGLTRMSGLLITRRKPHRQPTLTRLAPASGRHAQKVGDELTLRVAHLDAAHDIETALLCRLEERRVFRYRYHVCHQRRPRYPCDLDGQGPLPGDVPQRGRVDDNIKVGGI